jgi:hypothetical protein
MEDHDVKHLEDGSFRMCRNFRMEVPAWEEVLWGSLSLLGH